MPVTQVGAFFATTSKLLQRVYIPAVDDSEINQQSIQVGETLLNVPIATYQTGGAAAVQALIGTPTFSGRCAIVNLQNTVIDHLTADPALYHSANGQVIASDFTMVGDTWTGTSFTRVWLELDHTTGLVVATPTLAVINPAPTLNVLNLLIPQSIAPTAIIGSSIPGITSRIVAGTI